MLKEVVGRASEPLELADGSLLEAVFRHYSDLFPRLGEAGKSVVMARNQEFAPLSTPLVDGDEIAFLPPVSGGSDPYLHKIEDDAGHFFALTRQRIDAEGLGTQILAGEDGALVNFQGVVRNNTKGRPTRYLEYECYERMAIKKMAEIGHEIARAHQISRIAIVHRLGRMEIGETSVAVIAAAPHRRPAFEAALEGINRLKKLVPIWKKEYFADGEVWVEGEWDDSVLR
jgi:molybdopterin synthase catalytic subunit